MILWILLICMVSVGATAYVVLSLFRQVQERKVLLLENLQVTQEELVEKGKILDEIAETALGVVHQSVIDEKRVVIEKDLETLRSERGRGTIVQAEIEAVDLRLRELEEIQKELENSSMEAAREIEMLRAREKDLELHNDRLKGGLDNIVIEVDKLKHEVASHPEAIEELEKAKAEMAQTQGLLSFYGDQIALVNRKYLDLKRAYDALDIEYAQLYEKQSQV